MALPDLSRLLIGDSFTPIFTDVRYSLTTVLNDAARWRNATRKRLALQSADPSDDERERLELIALAIREFATYRRWLLVCAAPPLAFTDDTGNAEVQVRMLRALSSLVDSLEGGAVGTTPSFNASQYDALTARYRDDVKDAVAAMKHFDEAEKRIVANENTAAFGIPHKKRLFTGPVGNTGEFGAAALGRQRVFQSWLHKVAMLTKIEAAEWFSEVFSKSFDGHFLPGCLYTGVRAVTPQDLTVEHVVPKDWCILAQRVDELVNVTRDSRLITLASGTANSSRGTRALSLVTRESQREIGDVDGPMGIEKVKLFLYDHHNFDAARKAWASRQTAYGFLLSPLLSDARKYAGSIAGDQLGSWLTWVQWKYAQQLMSASSPTDFESLLDWVRYYYFGGSNPLVHEVVAFASYKSLPAQYAVGIRDLLESRMHGTDALGRLMLDEVTARASIGKEADAAEAAAASAAEAVAASAARVERSKRQRVGVSWVSLPCPKTMDEC